jgi:hypothetical protein
MWDSIDIPSEILYMLKQHFHIQIRTKRSTTTFLGYIKDYGSPICNLIYLGYHVDESSAFQVMTNDIKANLIMLSGQGL